MPVRPHRIIIAAAAIALFAQPFSAVAARAESLAAARNREYAAVAARLGVDRLFVADPDAYQAREAESALRRRDAALADMDRRLRPSAEALARVKAEAEAIRDAHALVAYAGVANTLEALSAAAGAAARDLANGADADAAVASIAQHERALDHALADLERLERAQRQRLSDQPAALASLREHAAEARAELNGLRETLAAAPAPADMPGRKIEFVDAARAAAGRALYAASARPYAAPALPLGRVAGVGRAPARDRLDHLIREYRSPLLMANLTAAELTAAAADPEPGDTQPNTDVRFTPALAALAASLGNDPVRMFNYVHDEVDSELYFGSKKGSEGALYERAGNDADQASLLIGLLRASGVPARYAIGRVWLSASQARDLARATETQAAANALTSAGIPAVYVNRPGLEPVVEIEHTWAQAWLPFERYRGNLEAGATGHGWVDLDPFIKRYAFNDPVNLLGAPAFDPDAYLSTYTTTLPIDVWANGLRAYILANGLDCETLMSATRYRTIVPAGLETLPAALPVTQVSLLDAPTTLSAARRYAVNLQVQDAQGNVELDLDLDLPAAYGRRIDVTFPAATAADQAVIDANGTLSNTPAFLVNLRATLSVSETVVATGAPVRPGADRRLVATFTTPGLASATGQIGHWMQAGGVYAFGMDYESLPQRLIDEADARLAELPPGDGREAQVLHVALLTYFREFDRARDVAAGVLQSGVIRDVGAGFAARKVKVTGAFGAPTRVAPSSHFLDVPKLSLLIYDVEGGQDRAAQAATLIGYTSSALEHLVWQQRFAKDSVSAVKLLQLAAQGGQTLHTISGAGQVAGLGVGPDVKTAILDALNRGWRAKVSQNNVTRFDWTGAGYVLYDPATGSAGYLITGGLNGGETTSGGGDVFDACGEGASVSCLIQVLLNPRKALNAIISAIVGDPVNLTNGNLFESTSDLFVPGTGMPIAFSRTYNSLSPKPGRMGLGWTDGFSYRIAANDDGSRSFIDQDGHEYVFDSDGNGGYLRPPGFHRALTQTVYGYTLTSPAGAGLAFLPDGRLSLMFMPDGIGTSMVYSGALLANVVDVTGRTALTLTHDANNRLVSVLDAESRELTFGYDAAGRLITATDPGGLATTYGYDSAHRLTRKTNPMGQSDHFEYDAQGRAIRHINAVGAVESFVYDAYNRRAMVVNPSGDETIYEYDERGRVTRVTNTHGDTQRFGYDTDDNPVLRVDDRGNSVTSAYGSAGEVLSSTNSLGDTTLFAYDTRGLMISRTHVVSGTPVTERWTYNAAADVSTFIDGAGTIVTNTYDAYGQLIETTDSNGDVSRFGYSPNGVPVTTVRIARDADGVPTLYTSTVGLAPGGLINRITEPNGSTFTATLSATGRVLAVASPDGQTQASFNYDPAGRLTQVTDRLGMTATYSYDPAGRLTGQADALGRSLAVEYDEAGRVARRRDQTGGVTVYEYDALGRQTRVRHPDGSLSGYGYCAGQDTPCEFVTRDGTVVRNDLNDANEVITKTSGAGDTVSQQFDAFGRLVRKIDGEGAQTSFGYDAAGNLRQVVDALNQITSYAYDGGARLSGITDARGNTRLLKYDEFGRLIRVQDALANVTRVYYNTASNSVTKVDATGKSVQYQYDAFGDLASITGPDGTTIFTRSTARQLTSAGNSAGTLAYGYDTRGRVISTTQSTGGVSRTVRFGYDGSGAPVSITDPEGNQTVTVLDAARRVGAIIAPGGRQIRFDYDGKGNRTSTTLPNGVTTRYAYDADNRPIAQISTAADGRVLAAFANTYDRAGHRTSTTDASGGTTRFTYDALYRLTRVDYGDGRTQTFGYDGVGNRITQTVNSALTTYAYDAADRLVSENRAGVPITYTYDANGNLLSRSMLTATTTFTYNQFQLLKGLVTPDGSRWEFGYSPYGQRVYQVFTPTVGAVERTDFLLNGNAVLADYVRKSGGAPQATRYVLGTRTDEILAEESDGVYRYFVTDPAGSVVAALDDAGEIVERRGYDAFGARTQFGPATSRYAFTGREDIGDTGFMHYRARTYDTATGRFTTPDPVLGDLTLPETLHRYVYVKNDPVNLTDPTGATFFYDIFYDSFLKDKKAVFGLAKILTKAVFCAFFEPLCIAVNLVDTFVTAITSFVDIYGTYSSMDTEVQNCACALLGAVTVVVAILQLLELYYSAGAAVSKSLSVTATEVAREEVQTGVTAKIVGDILKELFAKVISRVATVVAMGNRSAKDNQNPIFTTVTAIVEIYLGYFGTKAVKGFDGFDFGGKGDQGKASRGVVVGLFKLVMAPEVVLGLCTFIYLLPEPGQPTDTDCRSHNCLDNR